MLKKGWACALFESYTSSKQTMACVKADEVSYYYALDDSMGQERDLKMNGSDYLEKNQVLSS